jgi:hypothetical protein
MTEEVNCAVGDLVAPYRCVPSKMLLEERNIIPLAICRLMCSQKTPIETVQREPTTA